MEQLALPEYHVIVNGLPHVENRLPALEKLLAVGRCQMVDADWINVWRDRQSLPVVDGGYWLRADPVHCLLMRDHLVLDDPAHLALEADEAQQLLLTLNQHFAPEGLNLSAPHPQRWYAWLERAPLITVGTVAETVGKNIATLLPSGADAALWRSYLNEAQMLLHDHPVNQTRAERGLPVVNSLWLHLPQPIPAGLREVQPQCLQQACATLLEELRKGEVAVLNLYFATDTHTRCYRVQRRDLWKFWRRRKALGDWIG